jgi:ribosomal protein S18 acetylase RimI-like enzyme
MLDSMLDTKAGLPAMPSPARAVPDSLIRTASQADAERCLEVLTRAFALDLPCRWVWPDRRQYLQAFPRFAQAFGGAAIELGTAHYHDSFSGVALWLPPGAAPDEESLMRVIRETVSDDRVEAVFSMFEQMGAYHPSEAHWHLPLIGVDPAHQSRGIGSALLRYALEQCDRQPLPAYLEATSPRNVALYERHGFAALGRIRVGDSPQIVPMLRRPR